MVSAMAWKLSAKLEEFIAPLIQEAGLSSTDTPSIVWSLGGSLEAPGRPPEALPARYALGWISQQNLGSFQTVQSAKFGRIAFHPSPSDLASSRRLIDFDGTDIVVR